MGLLGKANAKSDNVPNGNIPNEDTAPVDIRAFSIDIQALIDRFHFNNPLFHCLLLKPGSGDKNVFLEIAGMAGAYGIECSCLPNGNWLILMPGNLDIDLFSHRFSESSGSTIISQFSADSPSLAFKKIEIINE